MIACPAAATRNDAKPVSPLAGGDRPFDLSVERRFLLRRLTVRRRRERAGSDRRVSERRRPPVRGYFEGNSNRSSSTPATAAVTSAPVSSADSASRTWDSVAATAGLFGT